MKDVIHTPFGNFGVKQNNKPIEFNYTIKNYSSNKSSALIRLYVIDVETEEQEPLVCGFEDPIFEKLNKEEHSTTLFVENESLILGLCSINPNKQSYIMTTNNEYGFTYKEEKKITLILCCIEKDKFKDAKKVIEKAIRNEIGMTANIETSKNRKSGKPLFAILLFMLLSFVYLIFVFFLTKYNILGKETLKKIGFGILGVMLVSLALTNLSNQKEVKKRKKTKLTFFVSLLLLVVILISIGTVTYMCLCNTGFVKNKAVLGVGITMIGLVIMCWFTSEYKIEKTIENEFVKNDDTHEIAQQIKKPKLSNPIVLNLSIMFPNKLKENWINLVDKLQIEDIKISEQATTYQLARDMVTIPYRVNLKDFDNIDLTELEKIMLYCVYTRHYDGHIREKYVKKLLEIELQEWEYPFLLKLSEEYVYEILAVIYNNLKSKDNQKLKEFAKNNKELLCNGYSKMLGYWNRFYREQRNLNFHNYVGRKLFRECFGYSRKYEKKKYQCACCENKTIFGYLIHYYNEPCPVCYWQNNSIQNNNLEIEGINKITLTEAKKNYQKFGAIKEEYVGLVRKPYDKEKVKINIDRILKLLKLELMKQGFKRSKNGIYEYKKQSFKITNCEEQLLIEKTINLETNSWELIGKIKLDNEFLVQETVMLMEKSCEKKKVVKLKKAEKDKIVEDEINAWNPLGLIKNNEPKDEYRLEIKKITTKLSKLKTQKELRKHIEQIFQELFGVNLFADKKKEIEEVAKKIWEKTHEK